MSKKVLFISQEIAPYVNATRMAAIGRAIPEKLQQAGDELRAFLPKWGHINERRNQLHEVIRLSGMNICIDDVDYPLLIKVASLQTAKMQVYFTDNNDLFRKRLIDVDEEGNEYEDNCERAVFYSRSSIETTKLLRWYPEIVQCQGWMAALIPFYLKTIYRDDAAFAHSKIVFMLDGNMLKRQLPDNINELIKFKELTDEDIAATGIDLKQPADLFRLAIKHSDAVVVSGPNVDPSLTDYAKSLALPIFQADSDEALLDGIAEFYENL